MVEQKTQHLLNCLLLWTEKKKRRKKEEQKDEEDEEKTGEGEKCQRMMMEK